MKQYKPFIFTNAELSENEKAQVKAYLKFTSDKLVDDMVEEAKQTGETLFRLTEDGQLHEYDPWRHK